MTSSGARKCIVVVATAGVITALIGVMPAALAADNVITQTREITASVFDGGNKRFVGGGALGTESQKENQQPLFLLADGATLKNVVIGSPAADGVHCVASCTLQNVTWEDVGEDAATFRGTNATVVVDGGSATDADDKVFQDNRGAGGSVTIKNFTVANFGQLYRSCGNCSAQAARTAKISNITAVTPGKAIVGANSNYGDRITLSNVTISGTNTAKVHICNLYQGNNTKAEPKLLSNEPDGITCTANKVVVQ